MTEAKFNSIDLLSTLRQEGKLQGGHGAKESKGQRNMYVNIWNDVFGKHLKGAY